MHSRCIFVLIFGLVCLLSILYKLNIQLIYHKINETELVLVRKLTGPIPQHLKYVYIYNISKIYKLSMYA